MALTFLDNDGIDGSRQVKVRQVLPDAPGIAQRTWLDHDARFTLPDARGR